MFQEFWPGLFLWLCTPQTTLISWNLFLILKKQSSKEGDGRRVAGFSGVLDNFARSNRELTRRHRKRHLKSEFAFSNFIANIPSRSIRQFFWSWILKDCMKVQRKRKSLSCVHLLHKTWNQALSRRSRAVTAKKCRKSVLHVQFCCFANLNLLILTEWNVVSGFQSLADYFKWDETTDNLTVMTLPSNLPWNKDHISDTPPSWLGDHPEFRQSELFPSVLYRENKKSDVT